MNKKLDYEPITVIRTDGEEIKLHVLKSELECVIENTFGAVTDLITNRNYHVVIRSKDTEPVFMALPIVEMNRDDLTLAEAMSLISKDSVLIPGDAAGKFYATPISALPLVVAMLTNALQDERVFEVREECICYPCGYKLLVTCLNVRMDFECSCCGDRTEHFGVYCADKEAIPKE